MRIGEMLIRDNRLLQVDLDRVIHRQSLEGGRIGSLLVAEGLIDAETLSVYLGMELGIPIANAATFERCKRTAVQILTPAQALYYQCVPIVIQGQTLIVAVDDPHDMQKLVEISQITGYRIIPRVAPEIYIYYFLEHFYGVPQPSAFRDLAEQRKPENSSLPGPCLPGLPPRQSAPDASSGTRIEMRINRLSQVTSIFQDEFETDEVTDESLELDTDDLLEELTMEVEPIDGHSPDDTDPDSQSIYRSPEPISLSAALLLIDETSRRGDIANAILGHASELFSVAALMLIRDNMAFGWKGFGPGLDSDRIETLLIPLECNSMFNVAYGEAMFFCATPWVNSLHSHLYKVLRTETPDSAIVVVCKIGDRVVNMLYGHTTSGHAIDSSTLEGLQTLMKRAGEGYVRLISKSKEEDKGSEQAE